MKNFLQIQNAEIFQGSEANAPYFEGWYYKMIDTTHSHILAIIPGIILSDDPTMSHAFVQILNGTTAAYYYIELPLNAFQTRTDVFFAQINDNFFSNQRIFLDVSTDEISLHVDVRFHNLHPLPFHGLSPGIMGWLSYLPIAFCNHGVISMDHTIQGKAEYNGKIWDFSDGKGYIEKDWGRTFPTNWIWMQCNHFGEKDRSLLFTVGRIPFLGSDSIGFLCLFYSKGKYYRFTSYDGSRFKILTMSSHFVQIQVWNLTHRLEIYAWKKPGDHTSSKTALMRTPNSGDMIEKCLETINGHVEIKFYKRRIKGFHVFPPRSLLSDHGHPAGLEIMGEKTHFI
jgi:tocopherol cyclase